MTSQVRGENNQPDRRFVVRQFIGTSAFHEGNLARESAATKAQQAQRRQQSNAQSLSRRRK
jgi:hypothetical protein